MVDQSTLISGLKQSPITTAANNIGVVQRLIAKAGEASKTVDDAVSVEIGSQTIAPNYDEPIISNRRGLAAYRAQSADEVDAPTNGEAFGPGKVIYGKFGNGKLQSRGGLTGTYEAASSLGPIKFKLGDFEGYALSNFTGVAWNPKTKETYSFQLKLDGDSFVLGRFKPLESEELAKQNINFEGKVESDGSVKFNRGFTMQMGPNGEITMEAPAPGELKKEVKDEERLRNPGAYDGKFSGKGFIDGKGNMIVSFENGATIHAAYAIEDGVFKVKGYEVIGKDPIPAEPAKPAEVEVSAEEVANPVRAEIATDVLQAKPIALDRIRQKILNPQPLAYKPVEPLKVQEETLNSQDIAAKALAIQMAAMKLLEVEE